jgi:hypothetical protein
VDREEDSKSGGENSKTEQKKSDWEQTETRGGQSYCKKRSDWSNKIRLKEDSVTKGAQADWRVKIRLKEDSQTGGGQGD